MEVLIYKNQILYKNIFYQKIMDFKTVRVLFLLHILLFLQTVNGGLIFEIWRDREKGRTHKEKI